MKNLWRDDEASGLSDDLGLRVYSSRLLGRDPSLVLHGGGNTSVKIRELNLFGEEEEILYVKGSGWDLASIEAAGFSPVRMDHLLKLARLEHLGDMQMVNELKTHMTDAGAPTPSIETILHAVLPYRFVDHTHADAVVTITNTRDGAARIHEIYGPDVVIIPYVMPGFDLAKVVAERFPQHATMSTQGMILMNHGVFSFAHTAKESYARMIDLVGRAEYYLKAQNAWDLPPPLPRSRDKDLRLDLAELRTALSETAGYPVILSCHRDDESLAFARREDIKHISQQGPATPDHVIRTKRLPMLGRDLKSYVRDYKAYFEANAERSDDPVSMLDPAPRIILDPDLGMCTVGRRTVDTEINADIYRHTMEIIQRSELLGGYSALPEADIFSVEYWELEQAKLRKGGKPPVFAGEIALVTGAASGIGKACVESLLTRGAAVIGLDVNTEIETLYKRPDYIGITCDVTDTRALHQALDEIVIRFGGLDMLILNAGMFPSGCRISELSDEAWRGVMVVNLDANLSLMREAHPLLCLAPNKGRVVFIGSKNVPAPGPGAAAYSASKAALNQLMRVAALEWAGDGIRLNALHPDAVFDTGLWTEDIVKARADHYGMTVRQYKTKNLLKTEICSHDVAELAAEMCGPLFAKTTAAQVPVDGGNERVI
jgi:rhamnose utilization protein RhaD (predicted bifunctional aldolase and dehydrogenase)/NAD(P)-dependent dehydrogenase (short-subunit alcohol dehydrogenase family)